MVSHMTGNLGRKTRISAFVITGNGNGLAGFALGKAPVGKAALKMARNRAGQKLMYIPRYDEHTGKKYTIIFSDYAYIFLSIFVIRFYISVLHDFFAQFGNTKIFVKKMHAGYGLVCHRAIKACCEAIGIKDMHAKIEGSKNLQHTIKAFFIGLLQQVCVCV